MHANLTACPAKRGCTTNHRGGAIAHRTANLSSLNVMQRAKLLLTLKAMSLHSAKGTPGGISLMATCTDAQAQEAKVRSTYCDVQQSDCDSDPMVVSQIIRIHWSQSDHNKDALVSVRSVRS